MDCTGTGVSLLMPQPLPPHGPGTGSVSTQNLCTPPSESETPEHATRRVIRLNHTPADTWAVLDMLPQMIWKMQPDGTTEFFNQQWCEYTGIHPEEAGQKSWLHWVHPGDQPEVSLRWAQAQKTGTPFNVQCRLRHQSGKYRWFSIQAQAHSDLSGITSWLGSCTDIHQQRIYQSTLERSTRLQRDMLNASVDCIKVIQPDGNLSTMNKSGCLALLGITEPSEFGMTWLPLLPEQVRRRGRRALSVARHGKNARFAGMSQLPGQKPQYWDNILTPLKDDAGKTTTILCVSREVTQQRDAEMRLRIASDTDNLTGLLNRRSFTLKLKRLIKKSRQSGTQFGFLLVDLDHFKQINDTLGHDAGDHLLRTISGRFKSCFAESGFVARLGGDEFAIIIREVQGCEDIQKAAELALAQMSLPITYGGNHINGGMSIGGAIFPRDAKDIETLARCGDVALNDLKSNGRGGFRIFHPRMMEDAERTAAQLTLAAQVLHDRSVEPRYQPKVRLKDSTILGFEALLSWRSAEMGLQPASAIAEAYKDYELATKLSCMLREKVFSDMAAWHQKGFRLLPVSINAAPAEFLRDNFAERFLEKLEKFSIPASLIEIEITEHTLFARGSAFVVRALRKLRERGIRISLDNFGTGYSTLAQLGDYPVDGLRVDRGFVGHMHNEASAMAIVQAIRMLGSCLSLEVVAKGIETAHQSETLQSLGYCIGQGIYFGQLLSSEQAAQKLK